jgi:hypothetical protein
MVQCAAQKRTAKKESSKEASTEVMRADIMMNENQSGSGAREQSL